MLLTGPAADKRGLLAGGAVNDPKPRRVGGAASA